MVFYRDNQALSMAVMLRLASRQLRGKGAKTPNSDSKNEALETQFYWFKGLKIYKIRDINLIQNVLLTNLLPFSSLAVDLSAVRVLQAGEKKI